MTNRDGKSVSVIDPASGNTVTTIYNPSFYGPQGITVASDGKVYVSKNDGDSVSVIYPAAGNSVTAITNPGFHSRPGWRPVSAARSM